jgi:hypothetical protein
LQGLNSSCAWRTGILQGLEKLNIDSIKIVACGNGQVVYRRHKGLVKTITNIYSHLYPYNSATIQWK